MKPIKTILILLILATILSASIFIWIKSQSGVSGYPLDDAWIHQTYARNLAITGNLEFNVGEPSAGSTSPLWTFLLAIGYLLHIPYQIWSSILGIALLGSCGLAALAYLRSEVKDTSRWLLAGCLLIVTEWHLVWASVSGMETILQASLFIWVILECLRSKPKWIWLGIGIGLAVWVRPDGITLLGPAIMILVIRFVESQKDRVGTARQAIVGLLAASAIISGYMFFNFLLSGSVWPNTLYAKQFEYQVLLQTPLLSRFSDLWITFLTGGNIILLPGFIWGLWKAIQTRVWRLLAAYAWIAGYVLIYALRLPVVYQHGRYMMPVIAVFVVISLIGYSHMHFKKSQVRFYLQSTFRGIAILVSLGFLVIGARAYRIDVAAVDHLMVQPARWVKTNVQKGELIAAHDIGALGYFGEHEVLDLAGLINPEVIPIVRDYDKVIDYARAQGASHVILFPDWYGAGLEPPGELVYQSDAPEEILQGHSNMEIYALFE